MTPDSKRFRPGYSFGDMSLHHFVIVGPDDQPEWDAGHIARAICGTDVQAVQQRPLWKAAGQPCPHCIKVFRK